MNKYKLKYKFSGTFYRQSLNDVQTAKISLNDLIQQVQAVAIKNNYRTPERLHKSFGLDFLPLPTLIEVLRKTNNTDFTDSYEIETQQILQQATIYNYQFTTTNFSLNLTPEDPQIPDIWSDDNLSQQGTYEIYLDSSSYAGIPENIVKHIWEEAGEVISTKQPTEIIHQALQALDYNNFRCFKNRFLEIWLELKDLSPDIRSAITFFRQQQLNQQPDLSLLSANTQLLVNQYISKNNLPTTSHEQLLQLQADEAKQGSSALAIGRNKRSYIEEIITNAQEFLLVSSYIIEDESITELLSRKSQELTKGVWVLTDLRDEVIDYLDTQVAVSPNLNNVFRRANEKKRVCLQKLLDANIPIRSGTFHLKTVVSEKSAYLGSCNLTCGSLNRNLEAGIIYNNLTVRNAIINLFQHFWQHYSLDDVIPATNYDGFYLRSVQRFDLGSIKQWKSDFLLTPQQYYRDLVESLKTFHGDVLIYSRSFHPSQEILKLLDKPSIKLKVFVDSQFPPKISPLGCKHQLIDNFHAKVTLLGNQLAYIGGVNFNFKPKALFLKDAMFKTTNPEIITQIRQKLSTSN